MESYRVYSLCVFFFLTQHYVCVVMCRAFLLLLQHPFFFLRSIYFLEREGAWEGEGQRARDSQADSPLSEEPDAGLDLMTPRSRAELKPRVGHLIDFASQEPLLYFMCLLYSPVCLRPSHSDSLLFV